MDNKMIKQGLIWAGIFVVVLVLVSSLSGGKPSNAQEISYSDFLSRVERNQFQQVVIEDQTLTGLASDGTKVQTLSPRDPDLIKNLREKNVNIKVTSPRK